MKLRLRIMKRQTTANQIQDLANHRHQCFFQAGDQEWCHLQGRKRRCVGNERGHDVLRDHQVDKMLISACKYEICKEQASGAPMSEIIGQ